MSKLLLNYDETVKDYTGTFYASKKDIPFYKAKSLEERDIEKSDILYRITSLKEAEETEKGKFIKIRGNLYRITAYEEGEKKNNILGVVKTVEGYYVSVPKGSMIPVLILLIPIMAVGIGLATCNGSSKPVMEEPDKTVDKNIGNNPDGDEIRLPGIVKDPEMNVYRGFNSAKVSQKQTSVPLVNPEENTSYAEYIIYDRNYNQLYISDLISPGTHAEWNAYETLKTFGEHNLILVVNFYEPAMDETGNVTGYIPCDVSIQNDQFQITVVEE